MARRSGRYLTVPVLMVLVAVALAAPALAARRIVLFEESTNWGCPPCYTANPTIHQFLEDYSVAQVVAVKWHVWWPSGNDPFYLHNTAPVQTRMSYYGISAAPDVTTDGQNGPIPGSYGSMQTFVENRLAIPSPIALAVTGGINGSNFDVTITMDVEVAQPAGDYRLFCVLGEHHIHLPSPNGEQDHYDVFRHMTANTGEPVTLTSTGVQTFNRSIAFDASENPAELQVVVWVQNFATREVLNAATTWPAPQYYLRLAGGTPGVVNDANTPAVLTRTLVNLGQQNDVYDISTASGHIPATWTWQYTTSQGTFSGPSSLPLAAGAEETITVEIDSHGDPGGGLLELTFTSQNDPSVVRTQRFSKISNPTAIVYDDDGGASDEAMLLFGLDAAGVGWGLWEDAWGKLNGAQLATAPILFWTCGLSYPTLDPLDRPAISSFLAGGGKLFVTGQDIGWELCTSGSGNYDLNWYRDNLHATYSIDTAGYSLSGIAADPIGDGISYTLSVSSQPYPDGINPFGTGAVTSIQYNATYKGVVRWEGGGAKVVYMGHGFEGITDPSIQLLLVQRIIDWFGPVVGVPVAESAPVRSGLAPNFPNPFNPSTSIPFTLSRAGNTRIVIYDVAGRAVRELVSGVWAAGPHVAAWDGRDDAGRSLASGTYFYRLETPEIEATRSMVLVK